MRLFIDQFAPKKLTDFVLPERIMKQFENGLYGHMLFSGNPGMGKSALAKLLANQHNNRYFNISEEGRIDVLRSQITEYCTSVQLNDDGKQGDFKVVILDEIEGASQSFFDALRGFMDLYGKRVRFIATTNYINKVPDPIRSRFECVDFGFQSSDEEKTIYNKYGGRIKAIMLKALKMEVDDDALKFLVDKNFPDFRGILQDLQRLYVSKVTKVTLEEVKTKSYEFKSLYDMIIDGGSPETIHKMLMGDYATKAADVLSSLDNNFVNYITDNKPSHHYMIPHVIVKVCHYQSILHHVIDPAISMKACIFELMNVAEKGRKTATTVSA